MIKQNSNTHELVFGVHSIIELLKAKRRKIYTIYTTKPSPKAWQDVVKVLPKYVNVHYVSKDELTKLAFTADHQGIIALASPFQFRKKPFEPKNQKFLIILDGLQDPRNLGAILRSAYCTGVDGVILTQKGSSPITATALKASAGLAEHLEISLTSSALSAAQELKKNGYSIFVTSLQKSQNAIEVNFNLPLCIVIGSEGEGVSKGILSIGQNITLPQKTTDISYNASVAAGILLFWISTKNKVI